MNKLSGHWRYFTLILLFSILGMRALFHPGLFTAHDIWHQVARLYYYYSAFSDGQFPPYWVSTLAGGLGYPLFFFSYHLPWIFGLPLLKAGLDIPTTLKILFFLAYFFSGIFMYLFINNLLRHRLAALLSSILYLFAPYHFLTIFVGASMGIVFVFMFLPLLLLGITLVKEQQNSGVPIIALGFAGIILSHLEHALFLFPLIISFIIWGLITNHNRIIFLQKMFFGLLLGLLLSAFYLIPAIYYNQFTRIHQETGLTELYKRNFVNFSQLIYSKWGYGPIVNNAKDGEMSVQLGITQWISFVAVIVLLFSSKLKKNNKLLVICMLAALFISIFLMLDYSLSIWQFMEKFVILDYPFRELLSATFIGSVFAGILIANFRKVLQYTVFIFIIAIALYTNRNHTKVNLYTDIPLTTYIESEITTNSFNEYLPILADTRLLGKQTEILEGKNLKISNIKQTTDTLSLTVNTPTEASASIKQFYFPGQTLYLDNNVTNYRIDREGRINFRLPMGSHNVSVKYEEQPIIKISKLMTVSGILILVIFIIFHL